MCESNEVSEVGASVATLRRCAGAEIAAACGVLVWARRNLTTGRFSGARFNASYLPPVLQLLVLQDGDESADALRLRWLRGRSTAERLGWSCRRLSPTEGGGVSGLVDAPHRIDLRTSGSL